MIELLLLSAFVTRDLNDFMKSSPAAEEVHKAQQEKRRRHNVEIIRQSIQNALRPIPRNRGRDFSYEDIIRCAREACWTPEYETKEMVDEALKQLGLSKSDF